MITIKSMIQGINKAGYTITVNQIGMPDYTFWYVTVFLENKVAYMTSNCESYNEALSIAWQYAIENKQEVSVK